MVVTAFSEFQELGRLHPRSANPCAPTRLTSEPLKSGLVNQEVN